jgi:hypothetical protein
LIIFRIFCDINYTVRKPLESIPLKLIKSVKYLHESREDYLRMNKNSHILEIDREDMKIMPKGRG